MSDQLRLSAYGRTVALTGTPESLAAARAHLPPTYLPADYATPEATWAIDARQPWRAASELELWVAEHARGFIFVHAGCVAVDGRAILLPGCSMAGKSTLTAALIRAGAGYLSDEYAVLDSYGLVHPYARPLSLRSGMGDPPERIHPEDLGTTADAAVRAGLVATLRYEPGNPGMISNYLSRSQTIMDLLANTVPARARASEALAAAEAATVDAVGIRGARGEADGAAAYLLMLLAQH